VCTLLECSYHSYFFLSVCVCVIFTQCEPEVILLGPFDRGACKFTLVGSSVRGSILENGYLEL